MAYRPQQRDYGGHHLEWIAGVGHMDKRRPLRAQLRAGTRSARDRLDHSMAQLDLAQPAQYARFLRAQLDAREAIEEWADRHCPGLLRPPSTAWLLRDDLARLAEMDRSLADAHSARPAPLGPFLPPADCDPLGLAWVIAGSHQLGIEESLARLHACAWYTCAPPASFLADKRMTGFWHRLAPRLQEPVDAAEAEPALAAADAVLARFERAFAADPQRCREAA